MTAIEFDIDDIEPRRLISANAGLHPQAAGRVRAYWRKLAKDAAIDAYGHADDGQTWHRRVRIILTARFNDERRHDVGNLYPYVAKPIVDGLVDAQVIPDDDDHHLIGPDLRRDLVKGPHRITVRIEDLP